MSDGYIEAMLAGRRITKVVIEEEKLRLFLDDGKVLYVGLLDQPAEMVIELLDYCEDGELRVIAFD